MGMNTSRDTALLSLLPSTSLRAKKVLFRAMCEGASLLEIATWDAGRFADFKNCGAVTANELERWARSIDLSQPIESILAKPGKRDNETNLEKAPSEQSTYLLHRVADALQNANFGLHCAALVAVCDVLNELIVRSERGHSPTDEPLTDASYHDSSNPQCPGNSDLTGKVGFVCLCAKPPAAPNTESE